MSLSTGADDTSSAQKIDWEIPSGGVSRVVQLLFGGEEGRRVRETWNDGSRASPADRAKRSAVRNTIPYEQGHAGRGPAWTLRTVSVR